eukprot:g854.t1
MAACAISQFYILSPRGDTLISREYRGDIARGTAEIFFRKVKFWKGDAPPVFNVDGVNYLSVKKNGLYLVATTKYNVSPAMMLELLNRLTRVFKDYCGILSEESVRKNFILIYELLDEVLDYGTPQDTSTEVLKSYIHNEPIVVKRRKGQTFRLPTMGQKTTPPSAVQTPVWMGRGGKSGKQKNEIFVDILERLSVLYNASGYVLNSTIDGCIQMKSYLSGNPPLRLALNDDLVIGKENSHMGSCVVDNCNFHECVKLDEFESNRTLHFIPPDGEFVVMNYRITSDFRAPFKIFPFIEELSEHQVELIIKVRADIPDTNYGANVRIEFPVPKTTATVNTDLGVGGQRQTTEY